MTIAGFTAEARHGRAATLPALQYFRAVAAILVVLYHAACVFGPGGYQPIRSWEVGLMFGHAGVELFFVLSGFIICWIHYDRIGAAGEVPSYIRKRLVRIYPPVALVVVAWAALSFAAGMPMRPIEYLVSLTLIPFDFAYAPPALWTLTHEMAFYALFLLAFIRRWSDRPMPFSSRSACWRSSSSVRAWRSRHGAKLRWACLGSSSSPGRRRAMWRCSLVR